MILNLISGLICFLYSLLKRLVDCIKLIPHVLGRFLKQIVRHVDVLVGLGSLRGRASYVVFAKLSP
jgi:hypothetical protein